MIGDNVLIQIIKMRLCFILDRAVELNKQNMIFMEELVMGNLFDDFDLDVQKAVNVQEYVNPVPQTGASNCGVTWCASCDSIWCASVVVCRR